MPSRATIAAVSAGLAAGFLAAAIFMYRDFYIPGRQVRNFADLRSYASFVERYKQDHGAYPTRLVDAVPRENSSYSFWVRERDSWGHPLYYETDGRRFLLISFGRDGVRDAKPYATSGSPLNRIKEPCYDADRDTVLSSDGLCQGCGK